MRLASILLVVVFLLASCVLFAAQTKQDGGVKPNWWPGEGPGARPGDRNVVVGKVTAVTGSSIALQTLKGPVTFGVNSDTRVVIRGEQGTISQVKIGDTAAVKFAVVDDGRVAKVIRITAPVVVGKITAVTREGFTLQGKERTWSVAVGHNTKIMSHGYVGTIADLKVGYGAEVTGEVNGDTVRAAVVRFRPVVIKGVVESVTGSTLTVKAVNQRTGTVNVTDSTVILIRPRTAPNRRGTIADIKPDMPVNIGGHMIGDAQMRALWIDCLVGGNPPAPTKAKTEIKRSTVVPRKLR